MPAVKTAFTIPLFDKGTSTIFDNNVPLYLMSAVGNLVTGYCDSPITFNVGDYVRITGSEPDEYNGVVKVLSVDSSIDNPAPNFTFLARVPPGVFSFYGSASVVKVSSIIDLTDSYETVLLGQFAKDNTDFTAPELHVGYSNTDHIEDFVWFQKCTYVTDIWPQFNFSFRIPTAIRYLCAFCTASYLSGTIHLTGSRLTRV